METNSTAPAAANIMGQAARAITTALCAAAFVVLLAFGGPDADSSRWDSDIDAHSDATYELALDGNVSLGT